MRIFWMASMVVVAIAASVYVLKSRHSDRVERASDKVAISADEGGGAVIDGGGIGGQSAVAGDVTHQAPAQARIRAAGVDYGGDSTATRPHSAMERAMLSGEALNERAMALLEAKNFDGQLTKLESEQLGVTSELTTAYRAELERSLASVDAPKQIDRLVCGVAVCVGSIRSPVRDWYEGWFDGVQERSGLPMTTLTGKAIDLGGSGMEYRLLFSTSPAVKGFSGSAPPR